VAESVIVTTVGRLVRRKGVAWFVREVLPLLEEDGRPYLYLVVGRGGEREAIERAIAERDGALPVKLLGGISDEALRLLRELPPGPVSRARGIALLEKIIDLRAQLAELDNKGP